MNPELEKLLKQAKLRKRSETSTARETATGVDSFNAPQSANTWREQMWGALPVNITDDPNFKPTNPIPTTAVKKKLLISKMSAAEAEQLLKKKLEREE
jgi:hypothetical protein